MTYRPNTPARNDDSDDDRDDPNPYATDYPARAQRGGNAPPERTKHPASPRKRESDSEPRRPDLRIVSKRSGRGGYAFVTLASYWMDAETGYYQGGIDRSVESITVVSRDEHGKRVTTILKPGAESEFLNAYIAQPNAS